MAIYPQTSLRPLDRTSRTAARVQRKYGDPLPTGILRTLPAAAADVVGGGLDRLKARGLRGVGQDAVDIAKTAGAGTASAAKLAYYGTGGPPPVSLRPAVPAAPSVLPKTPITGVTQADPAIVPPPVSLRPPPPALQPGGMRSLQPDGTWRTVQGAAPAPGQPDNTQLHAVAPRSSTLLREGYNLAAMAKGGVTGSMSVADQRAKVGLPAGLLRPQRLALGERLAGNASAAAAQQKEADRIAGTQQETIKADATRDAAATTAAGAVAAAGAKGSEKGRFTTSVDNATGDVTVTDTTDGSIRQIKAADDEKHPDDPTLVGLRAERDGLLEQISKGKLGGGLFGKSNPEKLAKVADKMQKRVSQLDAASAPAPDMAALVKQLEAKKGSPLDEAELAKVRARFQGA